MKESEARGDGHLGIPGTPRRRRHWGITALVTVPIAAAGTAAGTRWSTEGGTARPGAGVPGPRSWSPSSDSGPEPSTPAREQRTDCPADADLLSAAHERPPTSGTPWLGLKQCWAGWDTAVLITPRREEAEAEVVVFQDSGGRLTEVVSLPTSAEEGAGKGKCDILRRLEPPEDLLDYVCEGTPDPEPFDKVAALATMAHSSYGPLSPIEEQAGPLRAVLGIINGGRIIRVFLFHGNRFLGTVPLQDVSSVPKAAGTSVAIKQDRYGPDDAQCCPTGGPSSTASGGAVFVSSPNPRSPDR
ncbi:LppP/LprE family lipoprotein [Streptomyces sp. SAI-229]|uniref:LppP/LprE family lipoprotein n=1 Tax=Streptomyces sp. SAI-229 TaxID=3377731 RepID=UPI003C79E7F0